MRARGSSVRAFGVRRTLATLPAALALAACAPYPHYRTVIPPLAGVVTRAGLPVAGAGVRVGPGYVSCAGTHHVGVTDGAGRFAYAGERELVSFSMYARRRGGDGTLCIEDGGRAWVGARFFGGEVVCDLATAQPNEVPGVCLVK